jgi:hypothetical protein
MLDIQKVDTTSKKQVNEFIRLPFNLYQDTYQWVPPFIADMKKMLNRDKHPVYEHSEADFFLAYRDGEVVGRICGLENKPYNKSHETKRAFISLFECIDDQEVADALFERLYDWARPRGLNQALGPKGFGAFDGYGILIDGFEHRQMMTMVWYNFPYYQTLFETAGYEKEVDFVSCYVSKENIKLDDRVHEIARRVRERGSFQVHSIRTKRELIRWAPRIGEAYNKAFVNNWEYYPLSPAEVKQLVDDLILIADPRMIKFITKGEEIVGFLLGFPDATDALQRAKGRLTPWGIADMLITMRRAKWATFNGTGILPQHRGRGGNALMYDEMLATVKQFNFDYLDLPQVAETTIQMRQELKNLGGIEYKNHRVFIRDI